MLWVQFGENTFKVVPTEGLQHVIFEHSARNINKGVFMENVKKLIQLTAVLYAIIYDAPTVAYAVSTLTAPVCLLQRNPEKDYKVGYNKLNLREYLEKSKDAE